MARETKTVQCYPDDDVINDTCKLQASFGWELIGDQRCNEQQTFGDYVRTSTFNKLTFSREKSSPWYEEVVALEKQYSELMDSEPSCYANSPDKQWVIWGVLGLAFALMISLILGGMGLLASVFFLPLILLVAGAILLTVFIVKKVRYKNEYNEYLTRLAAWKKDSGVKAEEIRKKAEAIVNA